MLFSTYRHSRRKRPWWQRALLITLLVVGVAFCLALPFLIKQRLGKNDEPAEVVVKKVSRHLIVPTDEQPTLAVVSDASQLQDEFLAKNAKNGDQVLIYTKNKLVIVYRPSANKIAAVGGVSVDPAVGEAQDATLTVVDGANDPQRVDAMIAKIRKAYPNMKVTNGGSAARQLPHTIVIDNATTKTNLSQALVDTLAAKHGVLPLGIEGTNTDLMIIVGKDSP